MLRRYRAIFFDAGGTLFRPYPSVGEIYERVASKYGCKARAGELEKKFHDAWLKRDGLKALASHLSEKIERDWWRELVHEVFDEYALGGRFETFFEELYDVFARPSSWELFPDTLDVLKHLRKGKQKIGIVSNWDSRLFHLCEGLGLTPYFDFILASAVFGAAKPSDKIFKEALKLSGVEPHEAVHIGDSLEDDIHGARKSGIHAVLVDRKASGKKRDLSHLDELIVIEHLHELLS